MSQDRWEKARFLVVASLQVLGLLICSLPLWCNDFRTRTTCWVVLGVVFALSAGTMWVVSAFDVIAQNPRKAVKLSISFMYYIDITMLLVLMELTGGPAYSFYTPLIPILLTSALLAEAQSATRMEKDGREEVALSSARKSLFYALFAATGVVASFLMFEINPLPESAAEGWIVVLLTLGILVTPLIDYLPSRLARTRLRWLGHG